MALLLWMIIFLIPISCTAQQETKLQSLSQEFWQWRFRTQPSTPDDILRVERPDAWYPDYSPKAIENYRAKYLDFRRRLEQIPKKHWTRSDSVDYLCLRSAIERVNWELDVLCIPNRNPDFYVHQTLGALYELLVFNAPFTDERVQNLIHCLQSFPKTVKDAKQNLTEPSAPFAKIALDNLKEVGPKLLETQKALIPKMRAEHQLELEKAVKEGINALQNYRAWLEKNLPDMQRRFSCGREAYIYFLKNIALIPHSPQELLQQGRMEWNRAVAFESFEKSRNQGLGKPGLFSSADEQIAQARIDEQAIREFLEDKDIMSVPAWLPHYYNHKTPAHVKPLSFMGVTVDFTSENRLDQDASRYIPEPGPDLPYFYRTMAQDPRPIIIHEGVPGHYFQLARSWKNENPIRRRFVDSGPIEGIGLYVEELLLQFGLFEDRPSTREIIYNFMRLRALRVEIDVQLALGTFSIEQAGVFLAESVPMDEETAVAEAGFFAYNPGQAISYQVGKIQILKFLSDARIKMRDKFNLREFHDYLIENGNVPIALLRWEYLGLRDEIEQFFVKEDSDE